MAAAITCGQLAQQLGCELHGDSSVVLRGVAPLNRAGSGDLAFFANPKLAAQLDKTTAAAVLLRKEHVNRCKGTALTVSDPYLAYARAARLLFPLPPATGQRDPGLVIDPSARIAANVDIGAHAVIGRNVRIAAGARIGSFCWLGDDVEIGPQAVIDPGVKLYPGVRVGARSELRSGCVIGGDGFGFANDQGVWVKIPELGRVIIGDDVELGAHTTIDRGTQNDTVIGNGVKVDNQTQIGHNVRIGDHTLIAGCSGIAGSTEIGKYCTIGGGARISGHLTICDHTKITAQTFVTKSIFAPGTYSSGVPMEVNSSWRKNFVRFRSLDDMFRRLKGLERQLKKTG